MQLPMGSSSPPSNTASEEPTRTQTTSASNGADPYSGTSPPLNWTPPRLNLAPAPESQDAKLRDAVSLVAQVVTARIAYHQAEIDGLRRALRPFQDLSRAQPGPMVADDAVEQLLSIARHLAPKDGPNA